MDETVRIKDVREKQKNVHGEESCHLPSSECIVSLGTIVHSHSEPLTLDVIGLRMERSREVITAEEPRHP